MLSAIRSFMTIWTYNPRHARPQKPNPFGSFGRTFLPLNPFVDVLRVLSEDDDVHLLALLDRARHPLEIPHWPHARVEIQDLSNGHVEAPDAAPNGCSPRACSC